MSSPEIADNIENPFYIESNNTTLTCHVFCLPNAPSNTYFSLSHFAQKIRNLCWMLKSAGHRVIYYGYESCDVVCDEKIIVLPEDILLEAYPKYKKVFGHIDINEAPDNPAGIGYLEQRWTLEVGHQLQKRYKKDDFFFWMLPMCNQRALYHQVKDMPVRHIEPGIGYLGACLPYKVFQSAYIRDFHYGMYHANIKWWEILDENTKRSTQKSPYHLYTYVDWEMPPAHDAVIPNSYDISLFDFKTDKKDYLLYLARILEGKGIRQAVELAESLKTKLIVAGPGDFELSVGKEPSKYVEILGAVGVEERRKLLSEARAVLSLSRVHETFGGVAIEAMLSGTVPITANTGGFLETIRQGYNGYRIRFNDIEAGIKAVKNADTIDPYILRDCGLRYSREQGALKHDAYLRDLDTTLKYNNKEFLTNPPSVDYDEKINWPKEWIIPIDSKGEPNVKDI